LNISVEMSMNVEKLGESSVIINNGKKESITRVGRNRKWSLNINVN
jgi:hypothetical protein